MNEAIQVTKNHGHLKQEGMNHVITSYTEANQTTIIMKKAILFCSVFCQTILIGTVLNAQVVIGLEIQNECELGTINLYNYSDVSTTGPEIWTWDINGMIFPDYEVLGLLLPAGYYNVSLTLYDSLGFQGSDYNSFEIFPDADNFMVSSGGEACPGEPMQFWFDDRISPYYVMWTFGDNSVPEDQHKYNHPTHTFYEAGVYDVTLIIDHYCGPDTIVQQVNIGGTAKPDVHGYITNGPDFCPSDPVIFDVDNEYKSYLWNFGDGKTSTLKRPQHMYPTDVATNYTATVTVTNTCGNSDTDTLLVTFRDDLEAYAGFDFYFDSYSGYPCPNTAVEFNAWGAGIYEWDFGDGSFSDMQKAVNYYTKPGKYYVTLTVRNGCGSMDSRLDSVEVKLDPSDMPYADFYFEVEGMDDGEDWSDTIVVCPSMLINYHNESWSNSGASMSYKWDFGDGATALTKDAFHYYSTASATPYTVTLVAKNGCGGSDTLRKYVRVDASLMPEAMQGVTPLVICDGEAVYFYLEDGLEEGNYSFDIDFGDGTPPLTNATSYGDSILQTLANHIYTGEAGDTFNYVFSITNQCGNTLDQTGTIRITDDPGKKPFYYVNNTTSSGEGGPMQDWSTPSDPSDHEFVIHFIWPGWPMTQDKFAVFFWYEGFYPEGDLGPANGYVEFQSPNANYGDSVKAYIPLDPSYPPIIGFAVGWTCDGVYEQGVEPEVWGMQLDSLGLPQESFPLEPYGYTNMATVGDPVVLDLDMSWDGLCNDQRPGRHYFYQVNAGQYIQLNFDREDNEYDLYATRDQEGYDYISEISYGDYYLTGPTDMQLTDWYDCPEMSGDYQFIINGDSLQLIIIEDGCANRVKYLTDSIFMKKPDFGGEMYDMAGCPGDKVRFTIAGGASYEWHFGDGSPVSSEPYPIHVYAAPGDYDAFVIALNNCGRTDTIQTPVKISTSAAPFAYFWYEGSYEHSRLENIQFRYGDYYMDQVGNYSYYWEFGDGATSTLRDPVHAYERDGEYIISLTVTNGCGSTTETQWIYIKDAILACEAKIAIDSVVGRTVYLQDISRGDITNWFWDFGDGFTSGQQDPVYTYNYDGVFFVCLSVYDSINNCAHQVCRRVQIGTQNCVADFTAKVNTTTNKVQFTDLSTNATEWFWDFGDGSFSDLKDPLHLYEPGWYYVCLSIYNNASDCFAYRCMEVQVGVEDPTLCYADFSIFVDDSTNTVRFTDASSAGITNWYWTFGDGSYKEERNPVKTYKGPGIYEVCLIVFDKNTGCSDEVSMEIPVGVSDCNLRADFAFFIDITNSVVTFNDRSGGKPTKWFWNFGDGGTGSLQNPKHKYEKPGYYLVTLSVLDESNDCRDNMAEFIQIGAVDCRAAFEYKVDAATRNVQFYNKSTGTSAEYFWDFDDGTFSDVKDPVHQFSKPGIYFVSLTLVTGDGLCMDFFYEPIQVGTVDCAAEFKYFIDSATNVAYFTPEEIGSATAYLWFFGDGAIATGKTAQHRFTQPGYFTVGLNTFDESTTCMDYWEEVILIGSAGADCRAGFSYVSDPANKTIKFGDRSKGTIEDYIWDFGDGSPIGTEPNPVHTYARGGYYLVCLTVVNNFGIPNTFCDYVQLATADEERCFADFFFSIDSVSKTVEFMQQSHGNPNEFLWNFDDGETSIQENPEHTYSEAGYYMVGLSIKSSTLNCSSRRFKLVNVSEGNRGLRADFSFEVDSSDLKADTYPVDFVGVSLGDAGKLKWTFGDGKSDTTSMNPTHIYSVPGIYNACLIISNPITQDSDTTCQEVTTPGYGVGIDPERGWGERIGNYPNPFDQITYIVYDLMLGTSVDLVIFDQTGRMVDILVHENQEAGRHELEYDGSKLDSGIYTLRLATDRGVYTARMVVR